MLLRKEWLLTKVMVTGCDKVKRTRNQNGVGEDSEGYRRPCEKGKGYLYCWPVSKDNRYYKAEVYLL